MKKVLLVLGFVLALGTLAHAEICYSDITFDVYQQGGHNTYWEGCYLEDGSNQSWQVNYLEWRLDRYADLGY